MSCSAPIALTDAWSPLHYTIWSRAVPPRSLLPSVILHEDGKDTTTTADGSSDRLQGAVRVEPPSLLRADARRSVADAAEQAAAVIPAFFDYLRGDDTVLPVHPLLTGAQAAAFESFSLLRDGETPSTVVVSSGVEAADDPTSNEEDTINARHQLVCDQRNALGPVVALVDAALHALASASCADASTALSLRHADPSYGVVVCGAYGTVDDAVWATSTRSAQCRTTRDVFVTLRMSTKLAADLQRQHNEQRLLVTNRPAAMLRLVPNRVVQEAAELRGFVRLSRPAGSGAVAELLGIVQRRVDQIFEGAWACNPTGSADGRCVAGVHARVVRRVFAPVAAMLATSASVGSTGLEVVSAAAPLNCAEGSLGADILDAAGDIRLPQDIICSPVIVVIDALYESHTLPVILTSVAVHRPPPPEGEGGAENVPVYRLFRSYAGLVQHHTIAVNDNAEDTEGRLLFFASAGTELAGDGKLLTSHSPAPAEMSDAAALAAAMEQAAAAGDAEGAAFLRMLADRSRVEQ